MRLQEMPFAACRLIQIEFPLVVIPDPKVINNNTAGLNSIASLFGSPRSKVDKPFLFLIICRDLQRPRSKTPVKRLANDNIL